MRRLGIVVLDAFQFQRLHRGRLPLNFLLQSLQPFALLDHDAVQLLDLMFEMGNVGFKFFNPLGRFICHAMILPAREREVEAVNYLALHHSQNCETLAM
jgi:hypothetical protein